MLRDQGWMSGYQRCPSLTPRVVIFGLRLRVGQTTETLYSAILCVLCGEYGIKQPSGIRVGIYRKTLVALNSFDFERDIGSVHCE